MPTNILLASTPMPSKTDLSSSNLTLDLSIKSSSVKNSFKLATKSSSDKRMSSSTTTTTTVQDSPSPPKIPTPTTTDPGGGGSVSGTDSDEVKVFGCEKHEEDVDVDGDDNSDRLSPVIKEEESSPQQTTSTSLADRLNSDHQFHSFFPYFISPYYHAATGNGTTPFDKMPPLGSLSKFMSPPPAHMSSSNLAVDPSTGAPNPMYPLSSPTSLQSLYAQHWRPPIFPFVFPPGYPFSPAVISQGSSTLTASGHSPSSTQTTTHSSSSSSHKRSTHRRPMGSSPHQHSHSHPKLSMSMEGGGGGGGKQKKPHIKKPLNAFMLFMKEQRAQVVQECTLRESAAINQILGRKWHELDRNVQQKYYDMAREERMRHMQLYPGWSARDNYGSRKKRGSKGKKREKSQGENGECLNQKKCRARFGLDQQSNWCKHCKRKKKCLRYTEEDDTCGDGQNSIDGGPWSDDEDDSDNDDDDSNDVNCDITMIQHATASATHEDTSPLLRGGTSMDSDEENKSRMLLHQQPPNSNGSGSSSSTSGAAVPRSLITTTKDSASSSPQSSLLHLSHHRYLPVPPHFGAHHGYFDPFLQPTTMPLMNGLKRET